VSIYVDSTLRAILQKLASDAVTIHELTEKLKAAWRAHDDERARAAKIVETSKEDADRLASARKRVLTLEKQLRERDEGQRRIDVVAANRLHDVVTRELATADFSLSDAQTVLRWLRQPVGGAS